MIPPRLEARRFEALVQVPLSLERAGVAWRAVRLSGVR